MRKFQFETFPYKQLVLWLVQLPSAALGGTQGEPAVTQVGGGGQQLEFLNTGWVTPLNHVVEDRMNKVFKNLGEEITHPCPLDSFGPVQIAKMQSDII